MLANQRKFDTITAMVSTVKRFLHYFFAKEGVYPPAGLPSMGWFLLMVTTFLSIYHGLKRTAQCGHEEVRRILRRDAVMLWILELVKITYRFLTGFAANLNTWIKAGQDYAAEKYPGLKLVTDPVASDESQQEAYNQALALIQAYPDLKGILGYSTPAPIGIAKAVQEKDLNEQIAVVGTSMPNDSNEYLKDGSLDYAVLWDPAQLGKLAVYVAHLQLAGETLEGYEVPGVGPIHVEDDGKTIIMGPPTVWTAENVDDYDF